MSTINVTDATFGNDVIASDIPVVVDFWAEWCGPCKAIGPSLELIAEEMAGRIRIAKVNVDQNPDIAGRLGIRSVPTLMIFKGGQLKSQKVGAMPAGQMKAWIGAVLPA